MARMTRAAYAATYGPTTGDLVRLGDTSLLAEVEREVPGVPTVLVDGRDLFWWGIRTPAAAERLRDALPGLRTPSQ